MVGCYLENCPFHNSKSQICNKDIVILNAFGQCGEVYDKNGNPRKVEKQSVKEEKIEEVKS